MNSLDSRLRAIEHASVSGAWRIWFLAPRPTLAPYVERFAVYSESGTAFSRRREPPAGMATIVFNLGAKLRIELANGGRGVFAAGQAFFSGLSDTFAISETDGAQTGAQVILTPLGARRLLGFPLEDVGDRLIDPIDVLGAAARRTIERLGEARSAELRLVILEEEVEHALARSPRPIPRDLVWSLRRLRDTSGRVGIASLAADLGRNRARLSGQFRHEFGMGPKLFARVLRFDSALRILRSGRRASWAELAAICGYADQAHLTRDFTAFAGSPPEAFARRALPDEGGFVD